MFRQLNQLYFDLPKYNFQMRRCSAQRAKGSLKNVQNSQLTAFGKRTGYE